jgi:adenylate cyclase
MLIKVERRQNQEARALLHGAIAMEPSYGRAHALLGWAEWWAAHCYWYPDQREGYRQAATHARDALACDSSDPWARMVTGRLSLSTVGQHQRALVELQTALNLNPSFALGRMVFGWALLRAGSFEEAIAETGKALRMSPLDSFSGFYAAIHGLALLGARRRGGPAPSARRSRSVCGILGPPQHAGQLLRALGPYRRSAGVHQRPQPNRSAAAHKRAPTEPEQVCAL